MEVLLTGGTGFVGRALVPALAAAGHRVRLLIRAGATRSSRRPPPAPGLRLCPADFRDPASLGAAFQGVEAVVHLVGIIREVGSQTFEQVHDRLSGDLLAAARAAGVRRWVHMSALGTRPGARSRYHRTKWAGEERVRSSGLSWTIFRPSLIYGPEDEFTNLFARLARWSPVIPVMGPGTNLLQPIAVEPVARAFARAVGEGSAAGITYDLCGPERMTFRELLRTIVAATGRRRWLLPVPWPVARFQAALLEIFVGRLLRQPPPLNRDQLLMLQEDNVGDGGPADRAFGLRHGRFLDDLAAYLGRS